MKTGYYWDTKISNDLFIGRWHWRCGYITGNSNTKEEAINDLKQCGAKEIYNTTLDGSGSTE